VHYSLIYKYSPQISVKTKAQKLGVIGFNWVFEQFHTFSTLSCVIPVVCVTNGREKNVVKQHN